MVNVCKCNLRFKEKVSTADQLEGMFHEAGRLLLWELETVSWRRRCLGLAMEEGGENGTSEMGGEGCVIQGEGQLQGYRTLPH